MTATYTPGSGLARDRVRLLLPDTNVDSAVFSDKELDEFLAMEAQNVPRAVALACETIGSSQLYLLKVIRALDLTTDGAAVSREYRQRAKELRNRADELEAAEDDGCFDVAEMTVDHFSWRDQVFNAAIRDL